MVVKSVLTELERVLPPWPYVAGPWGPPVCLATLRDQENRIRVAIDDLVEFLNVMGAD